MSKYPRTQQKTIDRGGRGQAAHWGDANGGAVRNERDGGAPLPPHGEKDQQRSQKAVAALRVSEKNSPARLLGTRRAGR